MKLSTVSGQGHSECKYSPGQRAVPEVKSPLYFRLLWFFDHNFRQGKGFTLWFVSMHSALNYLSKDI